jgi:hypothetical protein
MRLKRRLMVVVRLFTKNVSASAVPTRNVVKYELFRGAINMRRQEVLTTDSRNNRELMAKLPA